MTTTKRGKRLSAAARKRVAQARAAKGFSAWNPGAAPQLRLFDHVSLAPRETRPALPGDGQMALPLPEPEPEQPGLFDGIGEAPQTRRAGGVASA